MYVYKLPNAAASMITVTSTATTLLDLIETAASEAHGIPGGANAVDIIPEDGDVRVLMDGNTPTATQGLLLQEGVLYSLRNVPLTKMKLIRTSGNVSCSVQVGMSTPEEMSAFGSPGTNTSVSVDTEFPAAAAASDNYANPTTTDVKAFGMVWDGATWDRLPGTSADGVTVNLGTNNDVTLATLPDTAANDLAEINTAVTSKYISSIGHGVKTVTSAGTDEALASTTACKRVMIQAQTDNTGKIAVGASGVDATVATGTGVLLSAGDVLELDIDDLADVFIDATVNGEGVRYTYFN